MKFFHRPLIDKKYILAIALPIIYLTNILGQEFIPLSKSSDTQPLAFNVLFECDASVMWLGTNQGLFFFDGESFMPLVSVDSLQSDITAIGEDPTKKLMIGTSTGDIYFRSGGSLLPWKIEEGSPKNKITGMASTHDQFWFATYGEGVYVYDHHRLYNFDMSDGLLSNDIYGLEVDGEQVWVATDAGLNILSFKNEKKYIESIVKKDGLLDDIVLNIDKRRSGEMYIGYFESGSSDIDISTKEITHREEESFISEKLDNQGNLWTLDPSTGVHKTNSLLKYHATMRGPIQAMTLKNDEIILATANGVFSYLPALQMVTGGNYFSNQVNAISLAVDPDDKVWVGTFGDGVYCFDQNGNQIYHLTVKDGIAENSILDIDITDDEILLGTLGGITKLTQNTNGRDQDFEVENFGYTEGLGTNYVYAIKNDGLGNIFVGMDGQGLSRLSGSTIHEYNTIEEDVPLSIFNMKISENNNLILGSANHGLLSLNKKEDSIAIYENWSHYFGKEIFGCAFLGKAKTIVHTSEGIFIQPALDAPFANYNYDIVKKDFIPNLNAFVLDKQQGKYWIGGNNGLVSFDASILPNIIYPKVVIMNVRLFDEKVEMENKRDFLYNENFLQFNFVGQWYADFEKLKYEFRLNGLEENWRKTTEKTATYHHLPSGDYTFQVRTSLTEDFSNAQIASFAFSVKPPFWRHPIFLILTIGTALFFWFLFARNRERRIAEKESLAREKLESQYQALKSHINPHFLFNSFNTLLGSIEEDPKMAVEYVEKLSDFYRDILKLRERNLIALSEEMVLVQNYVDMLKIRFEDGIHLEVDSFEEKILVPPLTIQMLVENAVKHNITAGDQPLYIMIKKYGKNYISVENNIQKKHQLEPSTKYGLENLRERYKLMSNDPVQVNESKEFFQVLIPIIYKNN